MEENIPWVISLLNPPCQSGSDSVKYCVSVQKVSKLSKYSVRKSRIHLFSPYAFFFCVDDGVL